LNNIISEQNMERFRKLGIIEPILKSIEEQKFEHPSEIQEKAIPLIIEGKDVIAGASTGSGKTLVFAAGIIKIAERGKGIQSLVLTPTRELAEQVSSTIAKFSKNKHLEIIPVYGGVSIEPQIRQLKSADVVVGTPGRILDHLNRGTIKFTHLKILVLDEADRMLDMGFQRDVEKIIRACPTKRQTLLFSATISDDISRLAGRYMKSPVEVSAEAYVDASKLTQIYYDAGEGQKFALLVHFLKNEKSGLVMVFCNTQRNTDFIARNLSKNGIDALAIHGGHSQSKRSHTMERFNLQKFSVLVCTDVASRGLDIKGVSHVYNYDIPKEAKEYIHRIGRTARAGKEGKVINIIGRRDYENFRNIRANGELNIEKGELPEVESVLISKERDSESYGGRGSYGGGGSRGSYGRGRESYGGRRESGRGESGRSYSRPEHRERREESGREGFKRGFRGEVYSSRGDSRRDSGRDSSRGEGRNNSRRDSDGNRRSTNFRKRRF
jgi:ATP-dependent RNA helicase DeaD